MRVPKRSFVFYSEIQIFENYTQMAIHSLQRNTQIYTEMAGLFVCFCFFFRFFSEIENFEICTQMAICSLITKSGILNVIPEWPFVFQKRKYEI